MSNLISSDFVANWSALGKQLLRQKSSCNIAQLGGSGVYSGVAPSGTVAANGIFTAGTAMVAHTSTSVPGTWLYFPAGAMANGVAGLYWCVWSSLTTAQVYSISTMPNTANGFDPYVPAAGSIAAVVGSGLAFTQTISTNIVVASYDIPAGLLGSRGAIMFEDGFSSNSSATAKSVSIRLSNSVIVTSSITTSPYIPHGPKFIRNIGDNAKQITYATVAGTVTTTLPVFTTINTSVSQKLQVCVQLAAATDWAVGCCNAFVIPRA